MATTPHNVSVDGYIIFGVVNWFWYKNHRGEVSHRHVIPHSIRFGSTPYHKEPQWLLETFDVQKRDYRTFALSEIYLEESDAKKAVPV